MVTLHEVGSDAERVGVVELARRIWFEHYPAIISWAQIHYMLERGYRPDIIAAEQGSGIQWHTARVDGELAGFVAFGPAGDDLKIHKLYVLRSLRKAGVGRALMKVVERAAIDGGCMGLVLTVNKFNLASIRAYLALGFSFAARVCAPIGYGFVMDDYVMRRPLP
jgi:GNAT superfamily N-acetyltransferase